MLKLHYQVGTHEQEGLTVVEVLPKERGGQVPHGALQPRGPAQGQGQAAEPAGLAYGTARGLEITEAAFLKGTHKISHSEM